MCTSDRWHRISIERIEDLSDAVLGAGLEATQLSAGHLSGGLAFCEQDGVTYSSGLINGRVSLYGPLSSNQITLGIGVHIAPGTRHWLHEVETGNVGVFLPGDDHDAIYTTGSIYASVTLAEERLQEEAARRDLVVNRETLGGTGVHDQKLPPRFLKWFQTSFSRIHDGKFASDSNRINRAVLNVLLAHFARPPIARNGGISSTCHIRIFARARDYIHEHLAEPISVDGIAAAAYTSRRTLFRAFADILDVTPRNYVRRLRLHRIRQNLACDIEKACTITLIANEWGISDPGRMSGWYRELFGERPSETLAHSRNPAP